MLKPTLLAEHVKHIPAMECSDGRMTTRLTLTFGCLGVN